MYSIYIINVIDLIFLFTLFGMSTDESSHSPGCARLTSSANPPINTSLNFSENICQKNCTTKKMSSPMQNITRKLLDRD